MPSDYITHNAVIIGGGFYGAVIATYLIKQRGFKCVTLIEREAGLLQKASFKNQARVHNGYHYPRSFLTAYRSRVNFPNFVRDYPNSIVQDFDKIYAVANRNSKLTAKQFERFCNDIGAKIKIAPNSLRSLFSSYLIDNVFLVEEYAFDSNKLAIWAKKELEDCGVRIYLKTNALGISRHSNKNLKVLFSQEGKPEESIITKYVFNCAYSGINQFQGDFGGIKTNIKHEITEMALVQPPLILKDLGITVMDGPFFSLMPFPARELHTLSHVRYTPHFQWLDKRGIDPYKKLDMYQSSTRVDRMMRDVERYMPSISKAKYIDSLFEIKTVLLKNEVDDGRPILFEKSLDLPGCYSILGGKIDNIYDVLEKLDAEQFLI